MTMTTNGGLAQTTLRALKDYLGVQTEENVLLIGDTGSSRELLDQLLSSAIELGAEASLVIMRPRARSGEEPPGPVGEAMLSAHVVLAAASKSVYHTHAKEAAVARGARGAFNAPPHLDAWTQGAMLADFTQIRRVAERMADRLRGASTVRVTSPAGTDVTMDIGGREPKGWLTGICRNPGEVSAWPGGEVSFPPIEGTSYGTVVIESVMTDIGRIVEPIVWTVREGHAVDIQGGEEAQRLRRHIEGVENATNIAELGIGLNEFARITSDITESKKARGTAHIALGDSAAGYGGNTVSDVHLDGLVRDVTIVVDGRPLVSDGKLDPELEDNS
jgi:leucyl aminopeptidase (aminopeptidase T)